MMVLVLAGAALAFLVWLGRGKPALIGAQWRTGAGLLAIGSLVAGAFMAIRGSWEVGLALAAVGVGLLYAARSRRGPVRLGTPATPSLSADEARRLLGVSRSATAADVKAAYARLMRVAHPDHGGTAGLAAQLNAARDRLLKG